MEGEITGSGIRTGPPSQRVEGELTVAVSKHDAGVLPSQLQSHSLQVAFGCCCLDQLTRLNHTKTPMRGTSTTPLVLLMAMPIKAFIF